MIDTDMALNKGFASPMSKERGGGGWGVGMGGNLKRKLQDILCLAVRKKTRLMMNVVMQAIGHYRAPCDWPKKQSRDDSRLHVKITRHRTKLKTRVVD